MHERKQEGFFYCFALKIHPGQWDRVLLFSWVHHKWMECKQKLWKGYLCRMEKWQREGKNISTWQCFKDYTVSNLARVVIQYVTQRWQRRVAGETFPSSFSLHLCFSAYIVASRHSGGSLVHSSMAVILILGPQGPAGVSVVVQQCYSETPLRHPKHVLPVRIPLSLAPPSV